MGRFKKEMKAFGNEFYRQGSILLFGKAPRPKPKPRPPKKSGAQKQYEMAQEWARKNGFKK